MYNYLKIKRKSVLFNSLLIIIRQALGVLGATINAFALTALVRLDLKGFLLQEIFLMVTWSVIIYLEGRMKIRQAELVQEIDILIRQDILLQIEQSEYQQFHHNTLGTYLSWLNNDIESINQKGFIPFFMMIQGVSGAVFSVIALYAYHWSLLLVTLISVGIMLLIPKAYKEKMHLVGFQSTKQQEDFVHKSEDALSGYNVLFNLRKLNLMTKNIIRYAIELKEVVLQQTKMETKVFQLGFFANIFFQIGLTAYTGYLAFLGIVPIGTIEATGALNGVIFTALGDLASQISSINSVAPIFEKHANFIGKINATERTSYLLVDFNYENVFQLKRVSFSYDTKPIFQDINLTIRNNSKNMIIGKSGSGKSTLCKILFGYYTPTAGEMFFYNRRITGENKELLKDHILYLNQEPFLFNTTIRENLCLDDNYTDTEILEALKQVGWEITKTDLDFPIGEKGSALSGGQRQRLVLARGLIRNRKIILMDESTSAIDEQTAILIEYNLLINPELTLIIVTHNPHHELLSLFDQVIHFPEDV